MELLLFLILIVLIGAFFPGLLWGIFYFFIALIIIYALYHIYLWLKKYINGDTNKAFFVSLIVLIIGFIIGSCLSY